MVRMGFQTGIFKAMAKIEETSIKDQKTGEFIPQSNDYSVCYENNGGEKFIVQGPVGTPRGKKGEEVIIVAKEDLILTVGTPVAINGLKNAINLNSKVGDVRSFDSEKDKYVVQFEGDNQPVSVKRRNLRILFELPDK